MNRVNAIIQARMGSTRLPGKVLIKIEDIPILEHIINRLRSVKRIDIIIVATSEESEDDAIEAFCKAKNVVCIRGSESNVLDRFGLVAKKFPSDIYIRATGDNPMIDIALIEKMLDFFIENELTYSCYKGFPLGSGVEIFTNISLREALLFADKPFELEHVTPYMYQRMVNRKVLYYTSSTNDSDIRMTIDTENDLLFAKKVFEKLYNTNPFFGISEIKRLLSDNPDLKKINYNIHQKILGE